MYTSYVNWLIATRHSSAAAAGLLTRSVTIFIENLGLVKVSLYQFICIHCDKLFTNVNHVEWALGSLEIFQNAIQAVLQDEGFKVPSYNIYG